MERHSDLDRRGTVPPLQVQVAAALAYFEEPVTD